LNDTEMAFEEFLSHEIVSLWRRVKFGIYYYKMFIFYATLDNF